MCGCLCTARGAEAKVRKRKKKKVRCEITSGRFRRIYSSCVVRCNPHNTIRTDGKTSGRRRQRGIVWKSAHRVKRVGGGTGGTCGLMQPRTEEAVYVCSRSSAVRNTMHACVFTLRHHLSLCATCQPASRTAAGGSRVLFSLFCVCVLCQSAKLLFFSFLFFFLSFFSKGKLFNSCVEQDQRHSKWKNSHSFFIFFFSFKAARRIREARQCGNDM